jgi:hypothetical protein
MLDKTYEIDFGRLSLADRDCSLYKEFSELIYEGNGSATLEEEWISFKSGDTMVTIEYILGLNGYFDECPGDYWTPPSSDFCLESANVEIRKLFIDDIEAEISPELEQILNSIVEKNIGI